jgi:hypothetical protein
MGHKVARKRDGQIVAEAQQLSALVREVTD